MIVFSSHNHDLTVLRTRYDYDVAYLGSIELCVHIVVHARLHVEKSSVEVLVQVVCHVVNAILVCVDYAPVNLGRCKDRLSTPNVSEHHLTSNVAEHQVIRNV
jgi:hypothetical protein